MGWSNAGWRSDDGGWYKNAAAGGGTSLAGTAQAVLWNPADAGTGATFANSNRDFTGGPSSFTTTRCTLSSTSALKYIEFQLMAVVTTTDSVGVGFANASATLSGSYLGNSPDGCMIWFASNTDFVSANITKVNAIAPGTSVSNDIYGLAINTTTGKAWFHKNGTYFGSGDPAAGTNPWTTFVTGGAWFPAGTQQAPAAATIRIPATTTYNAPSGFTVF